MKFAEVAGHEDFKESFRQMADSGRIPHAVLLSGPSGIGKMKMARAMAQYVHCRNRHNGDSCGECPSCRQHMSFNNPDLHFVYPVIKTKERFLSSDYSEEWRRMLTDYEYMPVEQWNEILEAGNKQPRYYVEEADKILETASLSTYKENYKIFLMWLPERMGAECSNKLLKLLEEPFEDTLFILVSNDSKGVLPTIYSRTQPFNLKLLPEQEIASWLERTRGMDWHKALETARLSEGSIGNAETLADGASELHEFGDMFREMMRMAYARQLTGLRRLAETCNSMNRPRQQRFLDYCARMVRENFIYNLRQPQLNLMTEEEEMFSRKFSPFIHSGNVEDMAEEFGKALRDIAGNANTRVVMFSLGLRLCQLIRTRKPD